MNIYIAIYVYKTDKKGFQGPGYPGPGPRVRMPGSRSRPSPGLMGPNMSPYPPIWIHIGDTNQYKFNMIEYNQHNTVFNKFI